MTHRDRAGDPSGHRAGRREAAGDAGHRQGFPTPSGGSPARSLWVIISAPWYKSAVTDHVRSQDCSEPTNSVLVCHAPPQLAGWGEKSLARFGEVLHRCGGSNSQGVSPASRTTDPKSHTPVGVRLATNHRTRHLPAKENHRRRTGYVDNSLPRVPAHTHCATTTALSLRNPMVDPTRTLRPCGYPAAVIAIHRS